MIFRHPDPTLTKRFRHTYNSASHHKWLGHLQFRRGIIANSLQKSVSVLVLILSVFSSASCLPTVVVRPHSITQHQPEGNMRQLHRGPLQKLALSPTPCCSPSRCTSHPSSCVFIPHASPTRIKIPNMSHPTKPHPRVDADGPTIARTAQAKVRILSRPSS